MTTSSLRPDLHRALLEIQDLHHGAVILDRHGDAWQYSRVLQSWYRAYGDDESLNHWGMAQQGPVRVLHEGVPRQ